MAEAAVVPPPPPDNFGVAEIEFVAGDTNTSLVVSWKNPNQPNIAGFNITWENTQDADDAGMQNLTAPDVSTLAGARVSITLEGLMHDATYNLTIVVLYTGGRAASVTAADPARTGPGGSNPTGDTDRDGVPNAADNCRGIVNPRQLNNDTDPLGDACDDDDDNDGLNDLADDCPRGDTGWTSNPSTDHDGDGCQDSDEDLDDDNDGTLDTADVDDNDNGLIEIYTLDDLARLRDDLNGDGEDDGNISDVTAVGAEGCPVPDGCRGYELMRSLNFSDADSYATGSGSSDNQAVWTNRSGNGWQPIGSCTAVDVVNLFVVRCRSYVSYAAVFDGRDHTLADLFISGPSTIRILGLGLFGAFNGSLQNLHLRNATINFGFDGVGALVGYGRNAHYENLSVRGSVISSPNADRVGGLIGDGQSATIRYARVSGTDVAGAGQVSELVGFVGGLVGNGPSAKIRHANVSGGRVAGGLAGGLIGLGDHANIRYAGVSGTDVTGSSGSVNVGGLVGRGENATIRYAGVSGADVSGNSNVGGLVGNGPSANIRYAGVSGVDVAGVNERVGGLIGRGENATIRYAGVSGADVSGNSNVGGLVGFGESANIRYVYVHNGSVAGTRDDAIGGLVGDGGKATIRYSYAAGGEVSTSNSLGGPGGLVGAADRITVNATYWDTDTTMLSTSALNLGEGKTTMELQSPTDFTTAAADGSANIYADWGNFWCDPRTDAEREDATATGPGAPFVRVWDLGTANQYPVLNCLPGGLSAQGR